MTKWAYAVAAMAVFGVEVVIAIFVEDALVRPYLGDVLAVLLVYLAFRAVTRLTVGQAAAAALVFALLTELAQLLGLLDAIGLRSNRVARTVLGGVFDVKDLVAYTVGALAAVWGEAALRRTNASRNKDSG
jgi:hypothetical protein